MIHLDFRDSRPIYVQIASNFRAQIASGVLQAGDKLPSVRELAAELVINPNTIQRAYRELEAQGFVVSVAGKGCFVCGTQPSHKEAQPLWDSFDAAMKKLLEQGICKEELIRHIRQGGEAHD